jgi:hypothetical protein
MNLIRPRISKLPCDATAYLLAGHQMRATSRPRNAQFINSRGSSFRNRLAAIRQTSSAMATTGGFSGSGRILAMLL